MRPYTLTQTDQNTVKSSCRRAGHTFFTLPNGGAQNKRQISLKVESVASVDSFPGELGFPSSKGVSANMGSFYFS